MREIVVRLMLSCICLQLVIGPAAFAEDVPRNAIPVIVDLDLPADKRPPVRANLKACKVAFASGSQKDEGVGLNFLDKNSPEAFEAQLQKVIAERGLAWFGGGTFYVTGIDMRNADQTRRAYQAILNRNGLSNKQVRVLDIPSRLLGDLSVGLAEHLLQRARYFLPSKERDYQTPDRDEVLANLKATAFVESFGVALVFATMPFEQALLLKTISLSVLAGYSIYQKSMMNWLLRFGSEKPENGNTRDNLIEGFNKQLLLSIPFTTNYQVVGNLDKIMEYYRAYGFDAVAAAFPHQFAQFATSTAGLLTVQQTIFYSMVVVGKFGSWMNSQVGDQNVADAKVIRPWIQIPILAADLVFLLMATGQGGVELFNVGPLSVNTGHAGLAALTAGSLLAFKAWPNMLDHVLKAYQGAKARRANRRAVRDHTTGEASFRAPTEDERQNP